jgi:hypothetical protein
LPTVAHFIVVVEQLMMSIRVSSDVVFIMIVEAILSLMIGLVVALMDFEVAEELFQHLVVLF